MLRRGRPCVCPKSIRHGSCGKRGDTRHDFSASIVTTAQKQGKTRSGGHSGPPLQSNYKHHIHQILTFTLLLPILTITTEPFERPTERDVVAPEAIVLAISVPLGE